MVVTIRSGGAGMSEERRAEIVTGRCLCHAVRFDIELPTLWSAHCHCTQCQRAHGAAFVTWVGVAEEAFTITAGKRAVTWHASSVDSERGFCRECGSTLFFRSERWPGEMHVVRANLDQEVDRKPEAHSYWDTHVDWVELGDDLPRKPG